MDDFEANTALKDVEMNNIPVWNPILPSSCPDQSHEKTRWTTSTLALFNGSERVKMMFRFDAKQGSYYGHDPKFN